MTNTMRATKNEPPTLTDAVFVSEASRILSLSCDTVRAWEKTGRLRAVRVGKGIRLFDRRDLERIAQERKAAAE